MTQPRFIEWVDAGWAGLAAKVAKRIGELQPLYADLGEMLRVRTQDRFKTGQAPDGTPWEPLADGSGRTPLTDSGTMAQQIAYQADDHGLELFMTAKQAPWHHFGTAPYTIKPKNKKALAFNGVVRRQVNHPGLPARPILGIGPADAREMEKLALAWLWADLGPTA